MAETVYFDDHLSPSRIDLDHAPAWVDAVGEHTEYELASVPLGANCFLRARRSPGSTPKTGCIVLNGKEISGPFVIVRLKNVWRYASMTAHEIMYWAQWVEEAKCR